MPKPAVKQVRSLDMNSANGNESEVLALLEDVDALESMPAAKVVEVTTQANEHAIFDSLLSEVTSVEGRKQQAQILLASTDFPRNRPPKPEAPPVLQQGRMAWQMWLAMVAAVALLVVLVAIGVFTAINEQSDQQEYLAAQNLSDIAMALTYAQIHQLKPQSHNWTDPDFILTNLERVLDGHFSSSAVIDAQGYLKDNPYLVRIYTNHDASQFLLMAQPAFSLWHWFSRQHSILLDSTTMQLRRTSDLRALNRLMANPNALTGANALDVSRLVAETDLISLKTLARETHQREFTPPRELKIIRPGAENLIHNAPRYYRFGGMLLESLAKMNPGSSSELKGIIEQLQRFRRLSSLVLYSDREQIANRSLENLKEYFPHESVMVGYLTFQRDSGAYIASQLLSQGFSVLNPLVEQDTSPSIDHYLYGQ